MTRALGLRRNISAIGCAPMRKSTLGMTLVEILAVVVILGMLAVTLTVGIAGKMGKARHEIARTQIAQLVTQLQAFQLDRRRVPTADEGLAILTTPAADPNASYFVEKAKLTDPWNRPYLYLEPGPEGRAFEILTYGSDGKPGGSDEAADLSSTALDR